MIGNLYHVWDGGGCTLKQKGWTIYRLWCIMFQGEGGSQLCSPSCIVSRVVSHLLLEDCKHFESPVISIFFWCTLQRNSSRNRLQSKLTKASWAFDHFLLAWTVISVLSDFVWKGVCCLMKINMLLGILICLLNSGTEKFIREISPVAREGIFNVPNISLAIGWTFEMCLC